MLASRNFLNRRIPERWFCFKFALSVLLPRKGKHSRERMNPLSRLNNPQELSGTLLCMKCLQRGRMFSQSSQSCVLEFKHCHKSSSFWKTAVSVSRNPSTSCENRSRARANTMLEYLHALSLPEPFSFFLLS